jgi:hypothetical protein
LYTFIRVHAHQYAAVQALCRVLQVSRSAYYSWKPGREGLADEKKKAVEQQVISIFEEHRRRYGVRRE